MELFGLGEQGTPSTVPGSSSLALGSSRLEAAPFPMGNCHSLSFILTNFPWELQLLLMERKLQEVHPLLTLCGQIVENWQGNPIQKESLRVFFLVLQVTHYLDAGQVRATFSPEGIFGVFL